MWTKILPLLFLAPVADAQYTISTFAGGRGAAVGQSVTTYGLDQPYAVAVDSAGNLYISLPLWNQVWVVNSSGTLTQVIGNGIAGFSGDNGPAAAAQLWTPYGVAVDSSGNLYIADYGNSRVRKVSGGIITTVAGNGGYGFSGDGDSATSAALYGPFGVAVDSSGSLYIIDYGNYRIRKVSGGIITTVAGNGTAGFSGDGGSATSAELDEAQGVAVDSSGNLYIADTGNHKIRKVSAGIITTVAGSGVEGFTGDGGSATSAELNYPYGVAVDNSGNFYIGDTFNNVIRKVSGGIITTVAGDGIQGFSGDGGSATSAALNSPNVGVDSSGQVYIVDSGNNRIRKVSGGVIGTVLGTGLAYGGDGGAATSATLFAPGGSAADGSGNLFIADTDDCVVRKVASGSGIISTVAGNGACGFSGDGGSALSAELYYPGGVAVDNSGNLYIADSYNNVVRKVSGGIITTAAGNGLWGFSGDGGSATSAELNYPAGVAVDSSGNLYIADAANNSIRKVSGGIITTVAGDGFPGFGGDGNSATSAGLAYPQGVAVDSSGNLYIADTGNGRIRKVSGGIIMTVAGDGSFGFSGDGGSATSAELNAAVGVAVDSSGNFYIADGDNERIRKVSGGTITTIAGDGTEGISGDGGSATSAELSYPRGVAVDSSGDVYIADSYNDRIRKLTPNGTIGITVTVSGAVQYGVAINVTGSTATSCTTFGGSCVLALTAGGTYTLTPSLAGYNFSPSSATLSNLSVSQTVSFTSVIQTYTVTASVSGSVKNGVVISVAGTTITSCTTNVSGSCSLTLIGGGTYALTPSLPGYNFFPASTTFSNLSANQTANFTEAVMFIVSGTVSGALQSGVTINVNGLTSTQTTTGASGTYSIPLLPGGSYTISAALAGYTFTPATYTLSNLTANQTANFTAAVDSPLDFYTVSPPCRIADTRAGAGFTGQFGPPTLAGGATRVFGILSSACAALIPSSVAAYSLNFTAIPPATGPAANLTTWPVGQPIPNASTLNYSSFVVANAAIVPAGTGGAIDVFVSYPADMLIDIDGYFAPPQTSGLEFFPVTPCRIADTRTYAGSPFAGQYGPPSLGATSTREFYIPATGGTSPGNTCGIPTTASAYSLNFAAVPPGGGSEANLTSWPGTQGMPNVSSLNFYSNVIANAAIVPAAPNGGMAGEMNVYVSASTNVLIDANGYFAPAQSSGYHFYPLQPCRIADTRSGAGFTGQFGPPTMATGQTRTFTLPQSSCEVPATAAAYSLNFTVIPPSTGQEANLTTWPAGTGIPNVSTLNYYGGVLANAAIVPAGASGAINVYVADATDVVIDIDGYFAP